MKTRFLLLGAIFVISGFIARGQVYEMYYQGFETTEAVNYTVTPSASEQYSSTLYMGGSRSLKLTQSTSEQATYITDTIDFTQNASLRYIVLEFDHICNLVTNQGNAELCKVYVKLAHQDDNSWTQLLGTEHYDRTETYSSSFVSLSSFSKNSYSEWSQPTMTNEYWKHERFNLNNVLTSSVPVNYRRLVFKFMIMRKTSGTVAANSGWWLDNIHIRASQNQIVSPTIDMVLYPDGGDHPSSRGARIELAASTTLPQGIDDDSVYVVYKVGSDSTEHRLFMSNYTQNSPVYGNRKVYRARIPFEGYDTVMQFYCVAKDATSNHNERTYPKSAGSWITYRCVRGSGRDYTPIPQVFTPSTYNTNNYPFPIFADNRAEFVYDSATLAEAGYGPGAITDLRYILGADMNTTQARSKFQLRMKNAPTNYVVNTNTTFPPFTNDYMHVVYDSTFVIGVGSAGSERQIHLKDTFFYAGKDIIVQTIYDNTPNVLPTTVKTITTAANKPTLFYYGKDAGFGANAYVDDEMKSSTNTDNHRPVFLITQHANQPLIYDVGVSDLVDPNYTTPITSVPAQVTVRLKNYGMATVNGVRIGYRIVSPTTADTLTGHFDWTGSLASMATTPVVIATGVTLAAGYHELSAWTEDTITVGSGTQHYRDHEPYNNMQSSSFIVCEGPLNGVRNIGGANADYNNIEEFLFSLSRCGINDSLVVRLAPGSYPPFSMPSVTGLTQQHYIVFEPQSGPVSIYCDTNHSVETVVNLDSVGNIRFRDLTFVRRGGLVSSLVSLGLNSHNCRFERCVFADSLYANPASVPPTMRIASLLNSGFSDNMRVTECTFFGGVIGVNLVGQAADHRAYGDRVERSLFRMQNNTAVRTQFLSNVTVKGNEMYDVTGNASYVLLVYACYDTVDVMANKIYTSHGAGAIGISDVHGSASRHAYIANNMIVCNDDGTANQLTSPLNYIQGEWVDVVYNSVKHTAPDRYSIAAATFGGGTGISNSRFLNNIVATFDQVNYAFNYIPSASNTNTIGNNIYYSEGYTLNRRSPGGTYSTLTAWQNAVPADSLSQSFDPGYLNGSLVDLRTFNRMVKGVGTPIAGVTTDMFDTVRNATAPCPGAFEFVSLLYDFEVEALVSPTDDCNMPASTEMVVRLRNNGVNNFTPGGSVPLSLGYSVNDGAPQTFAVTIPMPGDDTVTYSTGRMLTLPAGVTNDSVYSVKVWIICANDPNQTNDTSDFSVVSRYHEPAAATVNISIPYASNATIIPTTGVIDWPLYNATGAPTSRGILYWYHSIQDNEPFYSGDTLVTDTLRNDTVIYFMQHREIPLVRITQVQLKLSYTQGLTTPQPAWMFNPTGNNAAITPVLAVQLTNLGNDTAYLQGNKLYTVSPTSNINNKTITFGNTKLAPGQAIAVQYATGSAIPAYAPYTVHTGALLANNTNLRANLGLLYKEGTSVVDAVALNGVITVNSNQSVRWANQNVPTYAWSGDAKQISNDSVGGIYRVAFNGNASDWVEATDASPMFIDRIDNSWIRYSENGCPGDFAQAVVTLQSPPTADVALSSRPLASGCNLGMEDVSVYVRNYGTQPINGLTLNYNAGGSTVTEVLSVPLAAGGDTVYTFLQQINMATSVDSLFNVKIWASGVAGDTYHFNDTCWTSALAEFTPATPIRPTVDSVSYATADTITIYPGPGMIPVWYNSNMIPVDTSHTYITDILYADENVSVAYLVADSSMAVQVGTATTVNANTAYPSPYQANNKHAKQQFIYSASELQAQGLVAGPIWKVAFYLDAMLGTANSVTFDDYSIALGLTNDTIFASTTDWKTAGVVYSGTPFTLQRSSVGEWVEHVLDTPFMWDGVSSIVVQVACDLNTAYTSGIKTRYTAKTNTTLIKSNNNALATNVATIDFVGAGTKGNNRPNIMFGSVRYGCISGIATTTLHLVGVPDTDAKILLPDGVDSTVYNNCANVSMNVNVRNLGLSTLNGFKLKYYLDDQPVDSVEATTTLVAGEMTLTQLFNKHLDPGRHSVIAVVETPGDTITSNDTVALDFMVRFCGGTYTIAANNSSADYGSIGEAIDTLTIVGVDGPIMFQIASGTYNEQLLIQPFFGSSETNTVTFRGETDSTVFVSYTTASTANYVLKIDGAANIVIDQLDILSVPAATTGSNANYANAVDIGNADNITLSNSTVRVRGTVNNLNASCVVLQGNVSNFTVQNCWIDSGYYSVKSTGTEFNYRNLTFEGNRITNFWNRGIDLKGVTNLDITSNGIRSGVNVNGRGLVGLYLEQVDSVINIQKNQIYLVDDRNGGKVGIYLKNVFGSTYRWGFIANNMISGVGIGTAGGAPCTYPSGMYIDDGCAYLSIFYNTMRTSAGLQANGNGIANTRGLLIQGNNTNHLQVMNNIIANASKSYAYFVNLASNVSVSDYNALFSEGANIAKWGTDCSALADLQATSGKDANSLSEEPYFASESDLHLIKSNFATKAQYNTDVIDDIDGTIRPQIPAPTIGAHEMVRKSHNMSIVRILEPQMPASALKPNNVESDPIKVKVEFYNNGNSTETNVQWYAYLEGYESNTMSATRNIGTFLSGQGKTDSVMIPTSLGIIDTQTVRVVLLVAADDDTNDNKLTAPVYLAPAYDLKAERISPERTGCELYQTGVTITIRNAGFKDFPAGVQVQIGYHAQGYHPNYQANNPNANKLNIPTMPDTVIETHILTAPLDSNGLVTITFDSLANFNATDTVLNIKVRLTGWVKYVYDVNTSNDTTAPTPANATSATPLFDSYYTPASPVGRDTIFNYGTWGVVTASQVNSRPIRWYRDSTAAPFFPLDNDGNIINNYNTSRTWNTTPKYFHDSTYYLLCLSDKGCSSHFSQVHVGVAAQKPIDAALETVLAPVGGRVYMENDTVRVRIANYGTQPLSNIPITYAMRKGNNTNPIQVVTETYTGPLAPNQTYTYTFDSLLHFNDPLQGGSYQLRVWTDVEGDGERRNDTLRWVDKLRPAANNNTLLDYPFTALPVSTYPSGTIVSESNTVDIIRFSYNEIDIDLPPLGRSYTPLALPNGTVNANTFRNPEYPVLHVKRGTVDSMLIMITSPKDLNAVGRGKIAVYIDFNRNGSFQDAGECVVLPQQIWYNSLQAYQVAIPNSASYGYMRMCVVASVFESEPSPLISAESGHVIDFLMFVDSRPPAVDIALTQIVSPRSSLLRDDAPVTVAFRMANKGTQTVSSAQFRYRYILKVGDSISLSTGDFSWSGNLASGRSTIVEMPAHTFPQGTTKIQIWQTNSSDENSSNDTLTYEYHRFHVVTLTIDDDFDSLNYWYAPTGYNEYSRNYWQCGTPDKQRITMAYSEPNAWVTDLTSTIVSGRRGNVSYLYSPVINIALIRPDTISFLLQRNLVNSSYMYVEFYNYARQWQRLDDSTVTMWYNDAELEAFTGTSTGNAYNRYWISTDAISTDFNENLQFRFVYVTPLNNNTDAAFGEGCAVDDFRIGRARRRVDAGVVAITHPTEPKYGQTIYPKVVVKNFGLDTVTSIQVGYTHYGVYLAKISNYECLIPPLETDTFELTSPMIISSDYPDTFNIAAFTINTYDIYMDNDTTVSSFALSPLEDDISAHSFVSPLDRVIAGDSVTVVLRFRNFGLSDISNATLSYIVNGVTHVVEDVDIVSLIGRPLQSMEYFNYTFHQKFKAAMGVMNIQGIAVDDHNDYVYNDTISKRVEGISSITDIAAASVIVDTSSYSKVKVQLVIENRGARGANNFEVGFWYDNDTSTLFHETYSSQEPLPALSTGYHLFSIDLETRPAPWNHFVGYVHIDDDNDPSNDTTTEIGRQEVDIEVLGLIVEENAEPDCRVLIQLRNIGNLTLTGKTIPIRATVNGNDLSDNVIRTLQPGHIVSIEFSRRIPKDRMRHYEGSGRIQNIGADINPNNNQTTNVTVVNYFEGMPSVNAGQFVLDQNYPNPFSGLTTVPFSLPEAGNVRFFVMDAMGKIVNSLERFFPEGDNTITLDMESYSSGVYYYGIEVDGQRQMRKMILR